MGNFNRGNNRFGGGGRRDFSGRGSDRFEMHKAICGKCGSQCEVPFKPRGDKPVYCNTCFASNRNSESNFEGRNQDSRFERRSFDRPSYNRPNTDDRPMFKAVCDECGNECNLPFQPKNGKPVYCSKCFESKDNKRGNKNTESYKEQFEKLNSKLDKILKFLIPVSIPKIVQEQKIIKVTKDLKDTKIKKEKKKVEKKKTASKK